MSAFQRLLLGIAIGGLVAIFSYPTSRNLILHLLHARSIQQELSVNAITSSNAPIQFAKPIEKMSAEELLLASMQIAARMNQSKESSVGNEDLKLVKEFLSVAESRDPENAVWPQIAAIAASKAKLPDEAAKEWVRASKMNSWRNGSTEALATLWTVLADKEGTRLSSQGLLALQFRSNDTASLVLRVSQSANGPGAIVQSDLLRKAYTILNLSRIRDGTPSLDTGKSANQLIVEMATTSRFRRAVRPGEVEREQQMFVDALDRQGYKHLSQEVRRELRRNFAWTVILKPDETIASIRSNTTLRGVICSSLPSVLFFSALILGGLAYIGAALDGLFGAIPHPDARYVLGFSCLLGVTAYFVTEMWLFSIWVAFLGVLLATPVETASPDGITWSTPNKLVIIGLTLLSLFSIGVCCFSMTPSALIFAYGPNVDLKLFAMPTVWQPLAFLVVSLVVPFAALWAWQKQRAIFRVLGITLRNISTSGAIIGAFCSVVSTPICLVLDTGNSQTVEKWIVDEPTSFGIDQP